MSTSRLTIKGMTCLNCVRHVREALLAVDGVQQVQIDLTSGRAEIQGTAALPTLQKAVENAGYQSAQEESTCCDHDQPKRSWSGGMILALVVAAFLLLGEWVLGWHHATWFGWASFGLVSLVMGVAGRPFFINAWRLAQRGHSNMDTLVALGSGAAYGVSLYGVLQPGALAHSYFAEAAAIIGLISLGHDLERCITARAAGAMEGLLGRVPALAQRWRSNGNPEAVPVAELQVGDLVLVAPGERVPVDGTLEGTGGAVDESTFTGESRPVEKHAGERVLGGSLNLDRALRVRVTAIGAVTALARIVALVREAQQSRAAIQRMADRLSSIFVPTVLVLSLGTLLGTGFFGAVGWEESILRAIAVLIIACPCAMGLAAPAAMMVGTNVAARHGFLIRGAEALEKCGRITMVLFDKTGTLTEAAGQVSTKLVGSSNEAYVGSLVRGLVEPSLHPLSRLLQKHFTKQTAEPINDWQELRGCGLRGLLAGEIVRLGSLAWLRTEGVTITPEIEATVGLAKGSQLLAVFEIEPQLKAGTAGVIANLREQGLRVGLITGDRPAIAHQVAGALGIEPNLVYAEVKPEEKASVLRQWQERGERVAFVGDGINDGPALAQADLGIAVVGASDLAQESADILLLRRDIEAVPEVLDLARATLRTIKQNFVWALVYNAAAVPLAMIGQVSPIMCAAAMGLSDLCLLFNSLRLYLWQHKTKLPAENR